MRTNKLRPYYMPAGVFVFVAFTLSIIQLKVDFPMLLFERFFPGGGWVEIFIIACFGAMIAYKMQDVNQSAKWRKISWMVFSVWFFTQLLLGILADERFLLTGELHLPVPAMMISGPLYRGEKSIMTLLFLSTIVLTGPAWCSQLCYFGAIDNFMAKGKTSKKPISKKFRYKHTILAAIVAFTLVLRWLNVSPLWAAIGGGLFGIGGFFVIFLLTKKQKRMVHCTVYCPIGTVVNYLKYINPFRMTINPSCDLCMACTNKCKYDAMNYTNIEKKKPGITCTLCGDCLSACNKNAIQYKFLGLRPETARKLWLFLTISIYSVFLAMGRI